MFLEEICNKFQLNTNVENLNFVQTGNRFREPAKYMLFKSKFAVLPVVAVIESNPPCKQFRELVWFRLPARLSFCLVDNSIIIVAKAKFAIRSHDSSLS